MEREFNHIISELGAGDTILLLGKIAHNLIIPEQILFSEIVKILSNLQVLFFPFPVFSGKRSLCCLAAMWSGFSRASLLPFI